MEIESWLLDAISEKTGWDRRQIEDKVKKRVEEFPSLTEDAAARMLATESGVVPIRRKYEIKDLKQETNHVNIIGKIRRKFQVREINLKGTKSNIMNLVIDDGTGIMPVVVWDSKKVEVLDKEASEGDELHVVNAYTKNSRLTGNQELHLGTGSAIRVTKSAAVKTESGAPQARAFDRISDVVEGQKLYRIRCFLMRIFTNTTFIVRCTICKKKVIDACDVHGDKALSKILYISAIVDDGLSSIKATFFDRAAQKLLDFSRFKDMGDKLNDLSFSMYELDVTAAANKFNDNLSLNVRDVALPDYAI